MKLTLTATIILIFMTCEVAISRQKHDSGVLETEAKRIRRDVPMSDQAQLPQQSNAGPPFMMSSNLQASYFLGQCVMCPPGDPGPRGAPGPQGMPGRDGRDQLIIGPISEQNVLPNPDSSSGPSSHSEGTGVTYTRWGKTECPDTSQLVYHGVMASSGSASYKGSGVNYLCLPLEPTFADTPNYGNGGATLQGVEYESDLLTSRNIHQSEAPCAVCLATNKTTLLSVPGTNTCLGNQNWTREYHGYLMSSHNNHFKSEFVCVDQEAEGIPRTNHDNNGAILYIVDYLCGSSGGGLPCPPYVNAYDVLCAVCTL